jgi:hypothetical protein
MLLLVNSLLQKYGARGAQLWRGAYVSASRYMCSDQSICRKFTGIVHDDELAHWAHMHGKDYELTNAYTYA